MSRRTGRRTVPGSSISERYSGRAHTRARIGARSQFFGRLGQRDPFALGTDGAHSAMGADTALSVAGRAGSAAKESRLRLIDRLVAQRSTERLGERLRRVGPAAWDLRESALAGFSSSGSPFITLIDWDDDVDHAAQAERSDLKQTRFGRQRRVRQPARPMQRAMSQRGGHLGMADAVEQLMSAVGSRDRAQLRQGVQQIARTPAARRAAEARRVLRQVRGPSGSMMRHDLGRVVGLSGHRPLDVAKARSRGPTEPGARGLRTTLSGSSAVVALDGHRRVEGESWADLGVRAPALGQRPGRPTPRALAAGASGASAARLRSAHASDRAAPTVSSLAPAALTAVARRAVGVLGRRIGDPSRGLSVVRAEQALGVPLERITARGLAGLTRAGSKRALSSAATGWLSESLGARTSGPLDTVLAEIDLQTGPQGVSSAPAARWSDSVLAAAPVTPQRRLVPSSPGGPRGRPRSVRRARSRDSVGRPSRVGALQHASGDRMQAMPGTLRASTRSPGPSDQLSSAPTRYLRAPGGLLGRSGAHGGVGTHIVASGLEPVLSRERSWREARAATESVLFSVRRPGSEAVDSAVYVEGSARLDLLARSAPTVRGGAGPSTRTRAVRGGAGRRDPESQLGRGAGAQGRRSAAPATATQALASRVAPMSVHAAARAGGRPPFAAGHGSRGLTASPVRVGPVSAESLIFAASDSGTRSGSGELPAGVTSSVRASGRDRARRTVDSRGRRALRSRAVSSPSGPSSGTVASTGDRSTHDGVTALGRAAVRDAYAVRVSATGEPQLAPAALTHLSWAAPQVADWVDAEVGGSGTRDPKHGRSVGLGHSVHGPRSSALAERGAGGATWRAAQRAAAPGRADTLAPRSLDYLTAAPELVVAGARGVGFDASTPAPDTPLSRAEQRARVSVRADARGRVQVAPDVSAHVPGQRARVHGHDDPMQALRAGSRRSPATEASSPTTVVAAPASELQASPRPTARLARLARETARVDPAGREPKRSRQGQSPADARGARSSAAALVRAARAESPRSTLSRSVKPAYAAIMLTAVDPDVNAAGRDPSGSSELQATSRGRRRSERRPTSASSPALPTGLDLRVVAQRTAAAVHAAGRTSPSMLVMDSTRHAAATPSDVPPTVIATVQQDASSRVQRIVVRRAAGADSVELTLPLDTTRWAEARGVAGDDATAPERPAPGRRLAQRSLAGVPGTHRVAARTPVAANEARGPAVAQFAALGDMTLAALADRLPAAGPAEGIVAGAGAPQGRRQRRALRSRPAARAVGQRASARLGQTLGALSDSTPGSMSEARSRSAFDRGGELATLTAGQSGGFPESTALGGADGSPSVRPGWARRATGEGAPLSGGDGGLSRAGGLGLRGGGGLLTALARAGDPEEIVRVILERSTELEAELTGPARNIVRRIASSARADSARADRGRGDRQAGGARALSLLRPLMVSPVSTSDEGGESAGQRRSATRAAGLTNKLMKLIHLARDERRSSDAQRQVRMSEHGATAETRADTGAGKAGGESEEERVMNIKALRQDVIEAVLRELENIRWRREDPDGPSIWC